MSSRILEKSSMVSHSPNADEPQPNRSLTQRGQEAKIAGRRNVERGSSCPLSFKIHQYSGLVSITA